MSRLSSVEILSLWQAELSKLRACNICQHGRNDLLGKRICVFSGALHPRDIIKARSPEGFCGPEALHLLIPEKSQQ